MRVLGSTVDHQSRCVHYSGPTDIIAIRFYCCREYYPCYQCHETSAGHPAMLWPASAHHERALLCGVCETELTIAEYLTVTGCPACGAQFNPGCALHRHFYFESW